MEILGVELNIVYLLAIVFGGKIITRDEFANGLPFWLKGLLLRVNMFWRVLVYSAALGLIFYFTGIEDDKEIILTTYLIANAMYDMFLKSLIEGIGNVIVAFVNRKK